MTQVKGRPILFSTPMVQRILEGGKTQTRRLSGLNELNAYPGRTHGPHPLPGRPDMGYKGLTRSDYYVKDKKRFAAQPGLFHELHGIQPHGRLAGEAMNVIIVKCPFGAVGDQLWVRETTLNVEEHGYAGPVHLASEQGQAILDSGLGPGDDYAEVQPDQIRLRPSIFMPRVACRLLLEITNIRVERLQDISEADARAEGALAEFEIDAASFVQGRDIPASTHYLGFKHLWKEINGPNSWAQNPWVWAISFKRLSPAPAQAVGRK